MVHLMARKFNILEFLLQFWWLESSRFLNFYYNFMKAYVFKVHTLVGGTCFKVDKKHLELEPYQIIVGGTLIFCLRPNKHQEALERFICLLSAT